MRRLVGQGAVRRRRRLSLSVLMVCALLCFTIPLTLFAVALDDAARVDFPPNGAGVAGVRAFDTIGVDQEHVYDGASGLVTPIAGVPADGIPAGGFPCDATHHNGPSRGYDDGSNLDRTSARLGGYRSAPQTVLRGSGPVPGVLEASPRAQSVRAINNWNGRPVEFVFDPDSATFAMGRPAASTGLKGSPHQKLASAIDANGSTVVGGVVRRGPNGVLEWDEMSGHYWRNWNDDVRAQFVETLQGYGVNIR